MRKGAKISKCGTYRYYLNRIWDDKRPKIMFIMLNPSTADQVKDDPTIRRLIAFTKKWGYGGFYVCNLFAYRNKSIKELKHQIKSGFDVVGPENDKVMLKVFAREGIEKVIFAWGTNGSLMGRDNVVRALFKEAYYLELTKEGHPKHPLYLSSTLIPKPFIQNLLN